MFWVLKRTVLLYSKEPSQVDGSFEHPKHMLKLMGKKIFTILAENFRLSKPVYVHIGSGETIPQLL